LENSAEIDNKLDSLQEEKKLLKKINRNPESLAAFKNLARIYLWRKDFSSARWALLQAYHLDKEDNVVQDLLIELYEKRGGAR
jgi:cytochrome c-type biogenesis protein CcmH/NrfG